MPVPSGWRNTGAVAEPIADLTSMLIVTVVVLAAVGHDEVERVLADVGRERRPAEHAGAARRHRDLGVAVEVREIGRVVVVGEPAAVGVGAVEVDLELGADLGDLVGEPVQLGGSPPAQATE